MSGAEEIANKIIRGDYGDLTGDVLSHRSDKYGGSEFLEKNGAVIAGIAVGLVVVGLGVWAWKRSKSE